MSNLTQAPINYWDNWLYTCLPSNFDGNPFTINNLKSHLATILCLPLKLSTYLLSAIEPLLIVPDPTDFLNPKTFNMDATMLFTFFFLLR